MLKPILIHLIMCSIETVPGFAKERLIDNACHWSSWEPGTGSLLGKVRIERGVQKEA